MHLKPTCSSETWPRGLGALRMQPVDGAVDRLAIHSHTDKQLAILERCAADGWALEHQCGADVVIAVEEAWELVLDGGDDCRVLIRTGVDEEDAEAPDAGVLAWAALGVASRHAARAPGRG